MPKPKPQHRGLKGNFSLHQADNDVLAETIRAGDVVISMLPASMHLGIAEICIQKEVNFVSSSYISPEMAALDAKAKEKGLIFIKRGRS